MADAQQVQGHPAWFEEDGKEGQQKGLEEEGQELPTEDDGPVLDEVPVEELQPTQAELKTKEEQAKKATQTIPTATRRAPSWAKIPKDMKFPKGIDVIFARIRASTTMYPGKGDRQVIIWPMTDADQKLAIGRAMGDRNRANIEITKQMIRSIDGQRINWTGDPSQPGADVDQFWHDIGPKGRNLLDRIWTQLHTMSADELFDFFENCIAAVRTG